jgi:hypothetical protein
MVCKNKENGVTGALTMDDGILLCQFSQLLMDASPPSSNLSRNLARSHGFFWKQCSKKKTNVSGSCKTGP